MNAPLQELTHQQRYQEVVEGGDSAMQRPTAPDQIDPTTQNITQDFNAAHDQSTRLNLGIDKLCKLGD